MSNWLVIQLPDPITLDDIEWEDTDDMDDEAREISKSHARGEVVGYNAALADVRRRLTR